jgi:O-antigen ligase
MSAILGALEWTQLGFRAFVGFGPRPLALFLLPFLALYVSAWRYARNTKESTVTFFASLAVIILIIVSLSRIASMIAILIVLPGRFWHKSKMSQFAFGLVVGIGLITLWLGSPVVQQRFFPHKRGMIWDRNAIDMLRSVDTQGRKNLWAVTWLSAIQEPILGHGTGSSRVLINKTYPPLEHPHNDYLRILHDAGLVGLVLFLIAWGERLLRHWKKWWWLDKHKQRGARYHMAAFLSGIAMCTSFVTDNTMTYIFVGIPMFLLFALADTVALPQVNSKPALVNENSDHT